MQSASFSNIVRLLTLDQTPRVWSLLISVFGDFAQEDDTQLSGALLRQITKMIGIKPEAMRVALHRLRKEGWIESRRQGRSSVYFLTPSGRAQTMQASPRIYARGPAAQDAWLAIFNPQDAAPTDDTGGAWVSSNMLITSQRPVVPHAYVSHLTANAPLPDWMAGKVCSTTTLQMAKDFAAALDQVRGQLSTPLSALEIVVTRVLVVHGWRRIVLKTPILPDHVFPHGWAGAVCRASVTELLTNYPRPPLAESESELSPDQNG